MTAASTPGVSAAAAAVERALRTIAHQAELGAVWYLDAARARQEATRLHEQRAVGEAVGPLCGLPVLVKDAFAVAAMPGGAGGPVVEHARDAAAVAACRRSGGIIIGKAAMHQLGWGMTGQCPGRAPCANPAAWGREPGGSSSGSAAAVAAGIVRIALGADTAGSVRLPAAWCDVVGFKPERAAASRRGLAPVAPSFDAVGYLARSINDCCTMHQALTGGGASSRRRDVSGLRVAVDEALLADLDHEVAEAFDDALDALRRAGTLIVAESLPNHAIPIGRMLAWEFAREWGSVVDSFPELFGEDVRSGIARGRATARGQLDDAYHALQRIRKNAGLQADAVVCPACPMGPPPMGAPDDVRRAGRLLRPFNILDWPAITVPCRRASVPVGVQLAAPRSRDPVLFALAQALEEGQ